MAAGTGMGLTPAAVRGTMACVGARYWALSPAAGLALAQDAGLWANLRVASERREDGLSRLHRQLFFAPCHEAPIRRTRNASLPATHLTPELLGHVAGIGLLTAASDDAIHTRLRELGVAQLARQTGVSITRFVGLAKDFRAAAVLADGSVPELAPLLHPAHALTSTFAWELCASREDLLRYLLALHTYAPVLGDERLVKSAQYRAEWLRQEFTSVELTNEEGLADAARLLLGHEWDSLEPMQRLRGAGALELLAAASSTTGKTEGPPEVAQARYGFNGQIARADCVEVVLRQLIDWLAWCPARSGFDFRRLPYASGEVRAFWQKLQGEGHGAACSPAAREAQLGQRWFDICARLPRPCTFLTSSASEGGAYELAPTLGNLVSALSVLLGVPLKSIKDLEWLPGLAAVPMAALSVDVDSTWVDREGFTLRLGQRQLGVVLKDISNHAFIQHAKVRREHMARAGRLFSTAWQEGRLPVGPAYYLAARLLPCETLLCCDSATVRGSRAAAHLAVLSSRLLHPATVASALACEATWAGSGQQSSWGGTGLLPLLVASAGRHASLSGPEGALTVRSAGHIAQALHLLPPAERAVVTEQLTPVPPLAALVAIQAGDRALLARACRELSASELARLLWPALMIRRRRCSEESRLLGALHACADGTGWVLAAVVLGTAGLRALASAGGSVQSLRAALTTKAAGEDECWGRTGATARPRIK
ncbi:hypothetical protein T492DRAFT_844628 [Pavlovales sp. CCMP2436]|nr:hypothetical protein T492DRAFT_844628 [Pavlovales sp. CCMP2436]